MELTTFVLNTLYHPCQFDFLALTLPLSHCFNSPKVSPLVNADKVERYFLEDSWNQKCLSIASNP